MEKTEPSPTPELPGASTLHNGIHILTSVLLIIAVGDSLRQELAAGAVTLALCAIFAFLYFYGSGMWETWGNGPRVAWVLLLTAAWFALLPMSQAAVYLIVTMFFIYLRVFDDRRGIIAVLVATAVVIAVQIPGGLTFGTVMGPMVSAVVVLAIYYAFQRLWQVSRERQELIVQLMDTRTKLAETQREAGIVAERERIAHEIHDTVAQGLSSIQMLLHAADRELIATGLDEAARAPVATRIQQAREAASENLAEARAMIAALQPVALDENSLDTALQRVARSFSAAGQLEIGVEIDGTERELPMKIEAVLIRVTQGAVGNVVKHASASRARITVTYGEGDVRIDVVDNGKGFDPEAVAKRPVGLGHIGLSAMRRRVEEVGGTLDVESAPGEGTAVSVAIPA